MLIDDVGCVVAFSFFNVLLEVFALELTLFISILLAQTILLVRFLKMSQRHLE